MNKIGRFWGVIEKFLSVFMLVYKLQLVIFRQMAYTISLYASVRRIREKAVVLIFMVRRGTLILTNMAKDNDKQ